MFSSTQSVEEGFFIVTYRNANFYDMQLYSIPAKSNLSQRLRSKYPLEFDFRAAAEVKRKSVLRVAFDTHHKTVEVRPSKRIDEKDVRYVSLHFKDI